MLTAETGFAGGMTAYLGAGISYTAAYTKDLPFEQGIRNYQYVDRLTSFYEERGIRLHREQPGFLTGTLIPPGVGIAVAVLEMLMAAGQGVKHYSMGLCQSLDLFQDVAALWALEEVGREYLDRLGYGEVFFSIVTHQWMQAFPTDEPRAYAIIILGGIIAALSGATQIVTKSTHEAEGIPTKEANADGVKATRMAIRLMRQNRLPVTPRRYCRKNKSSCWKPGRSSTKPWKWVTETRFRLLCAACRRELWISPGPPTNTWPAGSFPSGTPRGPSGTWILRASLCLWR